jgi:hypothetical protein
MKFCAVFTPTYMRSTLLLSHIILSDSKGSILKETLFEINPGSDISFCLHLEILWVSKLAVLAQFLPADSMPMAKKITFYIGWIERFYFK